MYEIARRTLFSTLDKSGISLKPCIKALFRDSDRFPHLYNTEKPTATKLICGIPTDSENILNFVNPISPFIIRNRIFNVLEKNKSRA